LYQPINCPYCGLQDVEESTYCPNCGTYIFPWIPEEYNGYKTTYPIEKNSKQSFIIVGVILITVLLFIGIFSVIFTGLDDAFQVEDDIRPFVERTIPTNRAVGLEPIFSLTIFFSEPMTQSDNIHNALLGVRSQIL
jgi:hypothetical protein